MSDSTTDLEPLQIVDLGQAPTIEPPAPQPIEPDAKPAPRAKHVAHSEPAEPTEPARPTRDDAMRAIAERYEQKIRASELQYAETLSDEAHDRAVGQEVGTASQVRAAAADDAALASHAQEQPQTESQPTADTPGQPQRFAVSVNGQQYALTQEEILQLADVGGRAMHVLRQQQSAPQQPQQQLPTHVREQQAQRAPSTIDEPSARELVRRLSFGSEEEAARAIMQVQQGAVDATLAHMRQQQQPAPEHIANFATQQALQQIRLEQNLNTIGHEYPDVFNNNRRAQLAALTLHEIRQRDAMLGRGNRSDLDLYREACNTVIAELGIARSPQPNNPVQVNPPQSSNATQAPLQPTVASQATRAERKRAAPQQPSAVSRAASTDSPKQYPSASEIVERYRKQRGQVPMH